LPTVPSRLNLDASGNITTVPLITVPVRIVSPRTGAAPGFTGDSITLAGASPQAATFQIDEVPIGARIRAVRVRLKDSAVGPTTMNAALFPSVDGTYQAAIATSATSAGSGAVQTIPINGLTTTVAALTTYTVIVTTLAGAANTFVYAIDVDYDFGP